MSLAPHCNSTIYGVLLMGGQGLTASLLDRRARMLSHRQPLDAIVVPRHFTTSRPDARLRHAVGLLLVLAVLDHLVGNLREITWYLTGSTAAGVLGLDSSCSISPCRSCSCCFRLGQARLDGRVEGCCRHSRRETRRVFLAESRPSSIPIALPSAGWTWCCRCRSPRVARLFPPSTPRPGVLPVHDPQFEEPSGGFSKRTGDGRRPDRPVCISMYHTCGGLPANGGDGANGSHGETRNGVSL